jgi:hypothetical protein
MELESENEIVEYKIVFSSKQSLNQSKPRNKNQFESVSQTWTGFLTWTRKWVGFYGSVNHAQPSNRIQYQQNNCVRKNSHHAPTLKHKTMEIKEGESKDSRSANS